MAEFSEQDAHDLVLIARRAPLQNMDEAKAVNELLERFVDFYELSRTPDDTPEDE